MDIVIKHNQNDIQRKRSERFLQAGAVLTAAVLSVSLGLLHTPAAQAEEVTTIKQYSTIARPIDRDRTGPYALVVYNPTGASITVTAASFTVAGGAQLFGALGSGHVPASGWSLSGNNTASWSGSLNIPANSAQEFVVDIDSNRTNGTAVINTSVTITGQGSKTHNAYTTQEFSSNQPFGALWLSTDATISDREYVDATSTGNSADTYRVVLAETTGRGTLGTGGTLTITIPAGFTGVSCNTSTGWNTPSACNNTQIVVTNSSTVDNGQIAFSFNATPPNNTAQTLYNLYAQFNGSAGGTTVAPRLNAGLQVAGAPDTAPPTPDPPSFAPAPDDLSTSSIDMSASTVTDDSTPVEYQFAFSACASNGGTGGTSSGWQTGLTYTDAGLQTNKCYGYTVQARDSVPNTGTASSVSEAYTAAAIPGTPSLGSATPTALDLTNAENGNPSSNPTTLFAVQVVTTTPTDGTWLNQWVDGSGDPSATAVWLSDAALDALTLNGLENGTLYGVKVKARNQDNDETALSAEGQGTTKQAPETPTLSAPADVSATADTTPTVTWNVPVDADGDNLHFIVEFDTVDTFDSGSLKTFDSSVSPTGFSGSPPYTEGTGTADYTVQAGDALTETTWYWRVTAEDSDSLTSAASGAWEFNVDSSTPTPDPITFATAPDDASDTSIDMTATTATDASAVEYLFTFDACVANGGTGGTSSAWQVSTTYTDSGLQPNQCYGYNVTARDSVPNTGTASSDVDVYTAAATPGAPVLSNPAETTLDFANTENGNPASNPTTLFAVQVSSTSPTDATWDGKWVDAAGDPSATAVWLSDSAWDALQIQGLTKNTTYGFKSKARNEDNEETALSAEGQGTTAGSTFDLAAYRFFGNSDSTDVGSTLAAQDTAATAPAQGTPFRLRMLLHVGSLQLDQSGASFKLQVAAKVGGACDGDESYSDLATASGDIRFYNNTTPSDGAALTANGSDPAHGGDTVNNQSYEESNDFTNAQSAVPSGEDGQWDFSLVDFSAAPSTSYCVKAVNGSGTDLDAYTVVPEFTTADDVTAPTPDPMTYATAPDDASTTSMDMTATAGTDASPPVEYLFTYTACAGDAGTGGTSSAWQTSTSYTDSSLQPNQCYGYTVTGRDAVPNTGTASAAAEAYTAANTPGQPSLGSATPTTLALTHDANGNPASTPTTLFAVQVTSTTPSDATWLNKWVDAAGDPSASEVWLSDAALDAIVLQGLSNGTTYGVKSKARNQDGDETALSTEGSASTKSAPETPVLTDPPDDASSTDTTPTVTWNIPVDADGDNLHFIVEFDTANNFATGNLKTFDSSVSATGFSGSPPYTEGTGTASYTVQTGDALSETNWFWRVTAEDSDNLTSTPASEFNINIDTSAPFVKSSIPRPIDRNLTGPYALVVQNPTDSTITVTAVSFTVASGTQYWKQLGSGHVPASGWSVSGNNTASWSGSVDVAANSAQAFVVILESNRKTGTSIINTSATITGHGASTHSVYTTEQFNGSAAFAALWVDTNASLIDEEYVMYGGEAGTQETYTIVLAETSANDTISTGGTLTINLPSGFTGVSCNASTGWNTPSVCNDTQIVVTNSSTVSNSEIGFSFDATPPLLSTDELHEFAVQFDGTDSSANTVAPRLNAVHIVTGKHATQTALCSESGTNKIGMIALDHSGSGAPRLELAIWDGGSWTAIETGLDTDVRTTAFTNLACSWLGESGELLAVYNDAESTGDIDYLTWTSGGGWVLETDESYSAGSETELSLRLKRLPAENKAMLAFMDSDFDARLRIYDGSSWTVPTNANPLKTGISDVLGSDPLDMDFELISALPVAQVGNVAVQRKGDAVSIAWNTVTESQVGGFYVVRACKAKTCTPAAKHTKHPDEAQAKRLKEELNYTPPVQKELKEVRVEDYEPPPQDFEPAPESTHGSVLAAEPELAQGLDTLPAVESVIIRAERKEKKSANKENTPSKEIKTADVSEDGLTYERIMDQPIVSMGGEMTGHAYSWLDMNADPDLLDSEDYVYSIEVVERGSGDVVQRVGAITPDRTGRTTYMDVATGETEVATLDAPVDSIEDVVVQRVTRSGRFVGFQETAAGTVESTAADSTSVIRADLPAQALTNASTASEVDNVRDQIIQELASVQEGILPIKFHFSEEGLARIAAADLESGGWDLETLDPDALRLEAQAEQVAIRKVGLEDGSFDADDYIEFWSTPVETRYFKKNLYWLTQHEDGGLEIPETPVANGGATQLSYEHTQTDTGNEAYYGETPLEHHWFFDWELWSYGDVSENLDVEIEANDIIFTEPTGTLKLGLQGMSTWGWADPSYNRQHAVIYLNGTEIGDHEWDDDTYVELDLDFSLLLLQEGLNTVTIEPTHEEETLEQMFLVDYVELVYPRDLKAGAEGLVFSVTANASAKKKFEVSNYPDEEALVYLLETDGTVRHLTGAEVTGDAVEFSVEAETGDRLAVLTEAAVLTPERIEIDLPSELAATDDFPEYLIISPIEFLETLADYADLREAQLIDMQDIYDEYSYGLPDPEGLRAFLLHAADHWAEVALLVGDGHFDYRDFQGLNMPQYVPVILVPTDYGEMVSDSWYATEDDEIVPRMAVGRWPVRTLSELQSVIDKSTDYESGDVQPKSVFMSDNEPVFRATHELLAGYLPDADDLTHLEYGTLNAAATKAGWINAINNDAVGFLSYSGHGGVQLLSSAQLFKIADIDSLTNSEHFPVMLTLGCLSGYFAYPTGLDSLSERLLTAEEKGIVATLSSGGLSSVSEQQVLAQAWLRALMDYRQNLGEALTTAQRDAADRLPPSKARAVISTFNLLGDPSLKLKLD